MIDISKPMQTNVGGQWVDDVYRFILNGVDGVCIVFTYDTPAGEVLDQELMDSDYIRNKPEIRRYRVARFIGEGVVSAVSTEEQMKSYEAYYGFVEWISDWVEYEV